VDLEVGRFEPRCPRCDRDMVPDMVGEDAPLDPRSTYAATTAAQEFLVSAWARQTGGVAWSLGYHNVYGPVQIHPVDRLQGDHDLDATEVEQRGGVDRVDLVEVASTSTDRLFCFVAECRSECTEHARAPVGARRATQGDDDRARTEPCTARTASPSPVEVAVNGASLPRGRVCSPQVLAASTTRCRYRGPRPSPGAGGHPYVGAPTPLVMGTFTALRSRPEDRRPWMSGSSG